MKNIILLILIILISSCTTFSNGNQMTRSLDYMQIYELFNTKLQYDETYYYDPISISNYQNLKVHMKSISNDHSIENYYIYRNGRLYLYKEINGSDQLTYSEKRLYDKNNRIVTIEKEWPEKEKVILFKYVNTNHSSIVYMNDKPVYVIEYLNTGEISKVRSEETGESINFKNGFPITIEYNNGELVVEEFQSNDLPLKTTLTYKYDDRKWILNTTYNSDMNYLSRVKIDDRGIIVNARFCEFNNNLLERMYEQDENGSIMYEAEFKYAEEMVVELIEYNDGIKYSETNYEITK